MKINDTAKRIIASVVTLSPIGAGLLLWDRLPERLPIHWGINGEADGFAGKPIAVFLLPCILLVIFWLSSFLTVMDRRNDAQNKKVKGLMLWLIPCTSLFFCGFTYYAALGNRFDATSVMALIFGAMFAVLGNFMPKTKQNSVFGVKVKWTLENEENWNATHRYAGRLWFFGGIAVLFLAFLPDTVMYIALMTVLAVLVILPIVYSYKLHKKLQKEEEDK